MGSDIINIIFAGFLKFVTWIANFIVGKTSNYLNLPTLFLPALIIFIALLIIFVAIMLSGKILKIILIIIGIVLLVGIAYGFLSKI